MAFFSTSSPGRPRGSPGLCALFFWRRGKLWPFFPHLHRAGPAEALAFAHFSSGVGGNCGIFFRIFTGQAQRKPLGRSGGSPGLCTLFFWCKGEIVAFFSTSSPGRPRGSPGLCALVFWRRGKLWPFFPHLHRAGPAEALALHALLLTQGEIVAFFSTSSPGRPRRNPGFAHFSSGVGGHGVFFSGPRVVRSLKVLDASANFVNPHCAIIFFLNIASDITIVCLVCFLKYIIVKISFL